jgi:hypothetical protein
MPLEDWLFTLTEDELPDYDLALKVLMTEEFDSMLSGPITKMYSF